jgi:hypothetical protein
LDLGSFGQEVFQGCICILAMIDMSERLKGRVFLAVVPSGQVGWILKLPE